MKKIITLLALSSSILMLNAKYDTDYFKETDEFFSSLSNRYALSICKRSIPLKQAEKEKATGGEKIATYHWNIYGINDAQVFLATVTLDTSSPEIKTQLLKEIDEHFNKLKEKDSHIQLRSQTTTPVGDVIAQYQNPKFEQSPKLIGGQGKIVEVRFVP
ncbi:MAG TPA: hypothetical protein VHO47_04640 [Candidatus Babeliales bacterium]|nr:hypothetical protein [Candidatus Babeliales bacterium]